MCTWLGGIPTLYDDDTSGGGMTFWVRFFLCASDMILQVSSEDENINQDIEYIFGIRKINFELIF